ncbi:MAG: FAD-dependent oxidoreductase, partial [Acidobacteriaceae bacterium]|nr:FAD-dependent oxidoreductase [Acidobacteriaceae bacterium]
MRWLLLGVLAAGGVLWGQDVVVYGGTPAGIAAALHAARTGRQVVLVEPTGELGGMLTGGLSYTDFRSVESLQGMFRDYM